MNNGWIKFYRSAVEHPVFDDDKAFKVFIWLLANVDRNTGDMTTGRNWVSQALKMNPSTFYKAVKRLEKKYKIVTQVSNNRFTTISVLNWAKYQQTIEEVTQVSNNRVTTEEQQGNTYTRSKELRIKKNIYITPFLEKFNSLFGTSYRPTTGRIDKLTVRLKTYSIEDIYKSLENMARQPFYKGKNDRSWSADPDYFLRSDEIIDKHLNGKEDTPKKGVLDKYADRLN